MLGPVSDTIPIHVVSAAQNHSIPQSEIGKGYEHAKDQVVAISDEDLPELPLESIGPIRIVEGHYPVPDGQVAAKPYCPTAVPPVQA